MAQNKIDILLQVNDKATKNLDDAQKKIVKSSSSMAASFAKFAIAGVAAYAGISKAIQQASLDARFQQQKLAFSNLASSMGADAQSMVESLRQMSAETLTTSSVMQNASRAMILGLSPDKLPKLMEISRASARAFGTDVSFMFDSIVLGIGRQSRMILDNLGIIVSSEKAYKNYAATLGVSVDKLTDTQKRQAFLNETLKAGEDIINRVNVSGKNNAERLSSIGSNIKNVTSKLTSYITQNKLMSKIYEDLDQTASDLNKVLPGMKVPTPSSEELANLNEAIRLWESFRDINSQTQESIVNYNQLLERRQELEDNIAESQSRALQFARQKATEEAEIAATKAAELEVVAKKLENKLNAAFTTPLAGFISGSLKAKEAMKELGKNLVNVIANVIAETIIAHTIGQSLQKVATIFSIGQAKILESAWAAPAFLSAVATGGGSVAAGTAALTGGLVTSKAAIAALSTVPALAEGGIVTRPTTALIGEAGPEAVIPLNKSGGLGDINIFIQGGINPGGSSINDMAEELGVAFEREVRTARGF